MKLKALIFSLLALFAVATAAQAQEEVSLKLLKNSRDTTYRFCELTTKDGDTVAIRYVPQQWTKRAAFKDFAARLAAAEQERVSELKRLQRAAQKNVDWFAAQIDTIYGAGTYAELQHAKLKEAMQGAWSLIERVPGGNADPVVTTCVIQGDNLSTKDKTAAITWTNGETFRLNRPGVYSFNLDFKQDGERYVAERTASGVTTRYILKR